MKVLNALIWLVFIVTITSTRSFATPLEDEFVKRFGNDPNNTKTWSDMKSYCNEPDHIKVKKFAAGALRKISNAWDNIYFDVLDPVFKKGVLKFEVTNYQPMRMEMLGFTVHFKESTSKQVMNNLNAKNDDRWFVTQGLRKDCVYFLKWLHPGTDQWEFMLDKHVCGIKNKF